MAEPREPRPERDETLELRSDPDRHPPATPVAPAGRGSGTAWIWVALLALVVLGLVWYVLTRGEPRSREMPDVEVPTVAVPEQQGGIEAPGGAGEP